jgi:YD repeat-containing protein
VPASGRLALPCAAGRLSAVSFPDGRSETFSYHPSGKLASITEVPVSGSGTGSRSWSYTWSSANTGDELLAISRPDGTAPGAVTEYAYDCTSSGVCAGLGRLSESL